MNLAEVKEAITQLSFEERAELKNDAWAKQMAKDIEAGGLDEMISRAENEMKAGKFRELP